MFNSHRRVLYRTSTVRWPILEIEIHMQENRFIVRPKVTTITDLDLWFSPGQPSESVSSVRQLISVRSGRFKSYLTRILTTILMIRPDDFCSHSNFKRNYQGQPGLFVKTACYFGISIHSQGSAAWYSKFTHNLRVINSKSD